MPSGIYIRTDKIKKAISISKKLYFKTHENFFKGKKHSEKTRKKMSEMAKKRIGILNSFFGKKHDEETKKRIGLAKLGKKQTPEIIAKRILKLRGIALTAEHRRKISEAQKGERGNNWKGGIESINKKIHHSVDYKLWRESVFKRDNYTCRHCKMRGKKEFHINLHPHHIYGFAHYPKKRFELDNGVTLCIPCHYEFHRLYGEGKDHYKYFKTWEQI